MYILVLSSDQTCSTTHIPIRLSTVIGIRRENIPWKPPREWPGCRLKTPTFHKVWFGRRHTAELAPFTTRRFRSGRPFESHDTTISSPAPIIPNTDPYPLVAAVVPHIPLEVKRPSVCALIVEIFFKQTSSVTRNKITEEDV